MTEEGEVGKNKNNVIQQETYHSGVRKEWKPRKVGMSNAACNFTIGALN